MSVVKRNLLANFVGKGWAAVMGIAFIPLYIKFMGIEAYGLVGFFATLQSMFVVLDLGLTTTLNRELARCSVLPNKASQMRNLVRTLEIVYWAMAILIGVIVLSLSSFIAQGWIQAETLPISVVQQAVILMGLVLGVQWPLSFYSGGLLGLQKHDLYNGLNATWYTFRFAGVVIVLWLVSPTILTFFTYQLFVSLASTAFTALALWRNLPRSQQSSSFQIDLLRSIWRFTAGMSAISISALLLGQLDKIILSRLLSLEGFGYYTLASTVASGLIYLVSPIFTALFPIFSQLVALDDKKPLAILYHGSCQMVSVIMLPIAIGLVVFAPEILLLWTGDPTTVENTQWLVSFLVIGAALNGLFYLPHALQLAYGWTRLTIYTNLVASVLSVPAIIFSTKYYGALGAAVVRVVLMSGYVVIGIPLMHRRLLQGEQSQWYFYDVGLPLIASLGVISLGYWLIQGRSPSLIGVVSIIAIFSAMLTAPLVRNWMWARLKIALENLVSL